MQKRWNKTELDYLKRHAGRSVEELAEHFRTEAEDVERQLKSLDAERVKAGAFEDANLKVYDEALVALHKKQWQKAAKLFEKVRVAADSPHLSDRARQNLEVCKRRLDEPPPPEDPYLQAVLDKNEGRLDDALKLCKKHGKLDKEERYAYLAASILSLASVEDEALRDEALKHLEAAIRLEPKNRVHAFHDPDFEHLHGIDEFRELTTDPSA